MAEHLGVRTQVAGAARSVQDRRTGPTQHYSSSLQMWVTIRPTNGARRQSHSPRSPHIHPVARTWGPEQPDGPVLRTDPFHSLSGCHARSRPVSLSR